MSSQSSQSKSEEIHDESTLTLTTVEARKPYGFIPNKTRGMLGWHVGSSVNTDFGSRTVLLSDPFKSDPSIDEVVKIVSHEYLHDILEQEEDQDASIMLDNITDGGDFLIEREENGQNGYREPKKKYEDELE